MLNTFDSCLHNTGMRKTNYYMNLCDDSSENKPASSWLCQMKQCGTCSVFGSKTQSHCFCRGRLCAAPFWIIKNISCTQSHLEDILLSSQSVALSANVEGDDRQRWDLVTAHHVLKYNQHSLLSVPFIYQYHDFNQKQT